MSIPFDFKPQNHVECNNIKVTKASNNFKSLITPLKNKPEMASNDHACQNEVLTDTSIIELKKSWVF